VQASLLTLDIIGYKRITGHHHGVMSFRCDILNNLRGKFGLTLDKDAIGHRSQDDRTKSQLGRSASLGNVEVAQSVVGRHCKL
jgi:hypothetical protein